MNIFDGHCHVEAGWQEYDTSVSHKNVIFNTFGSYERHIAEVGAADTVTLVFDYKDHFAEVEKLHAEKKINALKIHSRIQKLTEDDYPRLVERLEQLKPRVPIIYDAFFFGPDLDVRPSLKAAALIAKKFRDVPVIIAHSGGIEILKYFYHLKSLDNIFFDLSLGLAYLKHTSVFMDYKNLLRFESSKRILWGTDYPYISPTAMLETFIEVADELNLTAESREDILFNNCAKLFLNK